MSAFVDTIAPVQGYARGRLEPASDQWTPLIGVADVARPDGAAARQFAGAVARWPGESVAACQRYRDDAAWLRSTLAAWQSVGTTVGGALAERCPGLAPAAPLAVQLADAAAVGLDGVAAISRGQKASAAWKAAALARLESDAEAHVGAELAIIAPLRQLVLAATAP